MIDFPKYTVMLSALLTLCVALVTFSVTVRTTSGFLVWSDGLAYYSYARSAVIDGNTDLTNEYQELEQRFPGDSKVTEPFRMWATRDATGHVYFNWPVGSGLVMTPFYAVGYGIEHALATFQGRPADSYGLIPQYFYCFGTLVYGLLAFWTMFLCCRQVTSDEGAYFSTLGIILGGPAVFYTFFNPSMAHVSSLGLVSLLTLLWWRQWHQGTSPKQIAVLGLILGILVTIRYQNALFGLLLAMLVLRETWRSELVRFIPLVSWGLTSCALPLMVLILHYYFYGIPETNIGLQEGGVVKLGYYPINLKSPYFWDVLFACRHGSLYWAPILGLGLAGLAWASCRHSWALVLLLTYLLNVYLIGGFSLPGSGLEMRSVLDWEHHWHGAPSFGMRYLTECAPCLAIGLATLIQFTARWIRTVWWFPLLSLLVFWNGLLVLAYGMNTISRSYCITYSDMLQGIIQSLAKAASGSL